MILLAAKTSARQGSKEVCLLALILLCAHPSRAQDDGWQAQVDAAVAKVKPALVRIHVVSTSYQGGREDKSESSGSGAIISPEGYVVTNHHVAGHATRLSCTLADKTEVKAELVGTDPLSDIAVIKLATRADLTSYPHAEWGDSSTIEVGDRVLAMGSPMALSQSVTLGIVSNTEMVMPDFWGPWGKFVLDGEDVGSMVLWIGHDADIYGGNSGGPLVDLKGRIIGINEIKMALSGAIPGNLAKEVAEELIASGSVERAWLGIEVQPRLDTQEASRGILIAGALEDSPASRAGFQSGDLLVKVKDQEIDVRYAEQLPRFNLLVADLPIGETVEMKVLRKEEEISLQILPEVREEVLRETFELKEWGMTVRNLSKVTALEMKLDRTEGVWVTSTRSGGPAGTSKPPLQSRDLILEVSGTPIATVEQLKEVTAKILEGDKETAEVLTLFERSGQELLTVVEIGIKELTDPGLEVRKAWLPVSTQVVTKDMAKFLGMSKSLGVRITKIFPQGDGEKVGLEAGDIIVKLDGEKLPIRDYEDYEVFPTLLRQYSIGTEVTLTVIRKGEELEIPVKLQESPKVVRELKRYRNEAFEFTVRELAYSDITSERWEEDQEGVLVSEVIPGGWAALADLSTEDLILEVNGEEIAGLDSIESRMETIEKEKPAGVVFKVRRGIHTLFLEVEPRW